MNKKRIVLGVTGSIAAPKAQRILSLLLRTHNCDVRVCMTNSAQKFLTSNALTGFLDVGAYTNLWEHPKGAGETHVEWGEWADAILIAPATASIISTLWVGMYNDPVSLVASMLNPSKWFFAPGMAGEMWEQFALKRNVKDLNSWGATFLGPIDGHVASGKLGKRMLEPEEIVKQLLAKL